jgi:hypothetical protein
MTEVRNLKSALPPAAFAVVGVAVCVLAWRDFQRVEPVSARPVVATNPAPDTLPGMPSAADATARGALADWTLFGIEDTAASAPPPAAPPVLDESALPESTVSYQLFGVIEADDARDARVILGVSDADQQEYRVGADAPDGARIHAIRARAVILERNGQLEQLRLPDADSVGAPGMPGAYSPRRLPGTAAMQAPGILSAPVMAPPDMYPPDAMPPPDSAPSPVIEQALESNPESP